MNKRFEVATTEANRLAKRQTDLQKAELEDLQSRNDLTRSEYHRKMDLEALFAMKESMAHPFRV